MYKLSIALNYNNYYVLLIVYFNIIMQFYYIYSKTLNV